MPATDAGLRLSTAHRAAQLGLARQTARAVTEAWRLVDLDRLDQIGAWERTAGLIVRGQRARSAALAADYLAAYRTAEAGSRIPIPGPDPLPVEQLATSMRVTGPVKLKTSLAQGLPLANALDLAVSASAGAAVRHTLSGGRSVTSNLIAEDPAVRGWARQAGLESCAFCGMLASRGFVYKEASFVASDARFSGPGDWKVHDSCGCQLVPAYKTGGRLPEGSQRYRDLWEQARRRANDDGDLARLHFRRMVERPHLHGAPAA